MTIKLARSYGFEKITCPLIFTVEGKLIGNAQQFEHHVKTTFGKNFKISNESKKRRVHANVDNVNDINKKVKFII